MSVANWGLPSGFSAGAKSIVAVPFLTSGRASGYNHQGGLRSNRGRDPWCLGQTGISGTDTENQVERYCNDVAGEFLLPAMELRQLTPSLHLSVATIAEQISTFAEAHRVSRPMVAYKLYRTGMIGKRMWAALDERFREEWQAYKQREAEGAKRVEGGPNYYVVRRHRIGDALLGLVRRSLDEGTITYTKASRVLGVKPRNVEPLLSLRGAR